MYNITIIIIIMYYVIMYNITIIIMYNVIMNNNNCV